MPSLLDLPLEIIGLVLNYLDFESVEPVLEAVPVLKQHVLVVTHDDTTERFFDIPDVPEFSELPVWIKDEESISERGLLLILYNMSGCDYEDLVEWDGEIKAFTAPVFNRLLRGPSSVFLHSVITREMGVNNVYNSAMRQLMSRGIKIQECHSGQYDSSFSMWPEIFMYPEYHALNYPSLPTYEFISGKSEITGTSTTKTMHITLSNPEITELSNTTFTNLEAVTIVAPFVKESSRPTLKNLHFTTSLVHLSIQYHTLVPDIKNITIDKEPGHACQFSLIDLDSNTTNQPRLRCARRPLHESELDLRFTEQFTTIEVIGGPVKKILDQCCLDNVERLFITHTYDDEEIEEIVGPEMTELHWKSTCEMNNPPKIQCGGLQSLIVSTSANTMDLERCITSAPRFLKNLSVCCAPNFTTGKATLIKLRWMSRLTNLAELTLRGVSAPFIEETSLQFAWLKEVRLEILKDVDAEQEEMDTDYMESYLSDTLALHALDDSPLDVLEVIPCIQRGRSRLDTGRSPWWALRTDGFRGQPWYLHIEGFDYIRMRRVDRKSLREWSGRDVVYWWYQLLPGLRYGSYYTRREDYTSALVL